MQKMSEARLAHVQGGDGCLESIGLGAAAGAGIGALGGVGVLPGAIIGGIGGWLACQAS
jgi:Bacteriocin class II with double-glycine leader peptide